METSSSPADTSLLKSGNEDILGKMAQADRILKLVPITKKRLKIRSAIEYEYELDILKITALSLV
jgi:hypothetical protein